MRESSVVEKSKVGRRDNMSKNIVYMDNSATTIQAREVTAAVMKSLESDFANPSSLHELGRKTQNEVGKARSIIAAELGVDSKGIVFTSGGTESINTVILGAADALKRKGRRIITTKIEHPAVLESCKRLESRGFEVIYLEVDRYGFPDLDMYRKALTGDVILVCVMAVNNEIGTVLPVREMCADAHRSGALFHVDAVQAFGKIDLTGCGADFISVSGHKIHGPKGVGAFYAGGGAKFNPLILGGGQEKGRRSGTENVNGIIGFGKAAELTGEERKREESSKSVNDSGSAAGSGGAESRENRNGGYVWSLRQRLINGLRNNIGDIKVNGPKKRGEVSDYILNVSFLGTRGEVILHALEADGIYVSTGSACSSNKRGQSHVLRAAGCTDREIESAIRFSLSRYNTAGEIDYTVERVAAAVARFRKLGSFR